jgi:hypothetical protein
MTQNRKRQPVRPQQSSTASTQSESDEQETQNEPESQQTPTTDESTAGEVERDEQDSDDTDEQDDDEQDIQEDPEDAPEGQSEPVEDTPKGKWSLPAEPAPEGRILNVGDPLKFEGEQVGNTVIVKEDVYRKVIPRGATTPTYVLLFRKGAHVSAAAVQSR